MSEKEQEELLRVLGASESDEKVEVGSEEGSKLEAASEGSEGSQNGNGNGSEGAESDNGLKSSKNKDGSKGVGEKAVKKAGSKGAAGRITEEQARILLAEEARKTQEGLRQGQRGRKMVVTVVVIGVIICAAAVIFGMVMGK